MLIDVTEEAVRQLIRLHSDMFEDVVVHLEDEVFNRILWNRRIKEQENGTYDEKYQQKYCQTNCVVTLRKLCQTDLSYADMVQSSAQTENETCDQSTEMNFLYSDRASQATYEKSTISTQTHLLYLKDSSNQTSRDILNLTDIEIQTDCLNITDSFQQTCIDLLNLTDCSSQTDNLNVTDSSYHITVVDNSCQTDIVELEISSMETLTSNVNRNEEDENCLLSQNNAEMSTQTIVEQQRVESSSQTVLHSVNKGMSSLDFCEHCTVKMEVKEEGSATVDVINDDGAERQNRKATIVENEVEITVPGSINSQNDDGAERKNRKATIVENEVEITVPGSINSQNDDGAERQNRKATIVENEVEITVSGSINSQKDDGAARQNRKATIVENEVEITVPGSINSQNDDGAERQNRKATIVENEAEITVPGSINSQNDECLTSLTQPCDVVLRTETTEQMQSEVLSSENLVVECSFVEDNSITKSDVVPERKDTNQQPALSDSTEPSTENSQSAHQTNVDKNSVLALSESAEQSTTNLPCPANSAHDDGTSFVASAESTEPSTADAQLAENTDSVNNRYDKTNANPESLTSLRMEFNDVEQVETNMQRPEHCPNIIEPCEQRDLPDVSTQGKTFAPTSSTLCEPTNLTEAMSLISKLVDRKPAMCDKGIQVDANDEEIQCVSKQNSGKKRKRHSNASPSDGGGMVLRRRSAVISNDATVKEASAKCETPQKKRPRTYIDLKMPSLEPVQVTDALLKNNTMPLLKPIKTLEEDVKGSRSEPELHVSESFATVAASAVAPDENTDLRAREMEYNFTCIENDVKPDNGDHPFFTGLKYIDIVQRVIKSDHPQVCDLCNEEFPTSKSLDAHVRKAHQGPSYYHTVDPTVNKPYTCSDCGKKFLTEKPFRKHRAKHNSTEKEVFECTLCEKTFTWKKSLKEHMRLHSGDGLFKCELCDKEFTRKKLLIQHLNVHTGETPYECQYCRRGFSDRANLSRHIKEIHLGVRYKCHVCEKSFSQKRYLIIHRRSHTGQKPFACEVCDKRFTRKDQQQLHMTTHSGQKPYKCEQCDKSYFQKTKLVVHKRSHTGEKPYKCEHCEKTFGCPTIFNRHKLIHTGVKPFKCLVCEKAFLQKAHLQGHIKKIHLNQKVETVV